VYARSTTLTGDPAAVGQGIAMVREEVLPAIRGMEGCLGLSMIVDREAGKGITTTSWDTLEAMAASRDRVRPLQMRAAELFGGGAPLVEEWEIASMHRTHNTHPGTCVRAAWSRVSPEHVDRALDYYKSALLPHIERAEGFISASLLVDRARGRGVLSVAYDSREAMERTRDEADYLRTRSTNEANVETLDAGEFELALAHLRVPELV
jgi:quinol monooxygenase YgiN